MDFLFQPFIEILIRIMSIFIVINISRLRFEQINPSNKDIEPEIAKIVEVENYNFDDIELKCIICFLKIDDRRDNHNNKHNLECCGSFVHLTHLIGWYKTKKSCPNCSTETPRIIVTV